jgi:ActR/RegA family two-component response regulator
MHHSLNSGPSEPIQSVAIKVLILTDEPEHARVMMGGLTRSQYDFLVCELRGRESLAADLEYELSAVRGKMPVIVMIDFNFVGESCEAVIDHIAALQGDMAIECVVFVFGEGVPLAQAVLEVH